MRATDGFQTTITLSPVNYEDQTLSLELELRMALPMPNHDEHLPDQIETIVHQTGLEAQRRLFQSLIEKADQQLVLQRRQGKGGADIAPVYWDDNYFELMPGETRRIDASYPRKMLGGSASYIQVDGWNVVPAPAK